MGSQTWENLIGRKPNLVPYGISSFESLFYSDHFISSQRQRAKRVLERPISQHSMHTCTMFLKKQVSFTCRWPATATIGPSYDFLNFDKNVKTSILIKVEDVSDLVWAFSHSLVIQIPGFLALYHSWLAIHGPYKLQYWFELWNSKINYSIKDHNNHLISRKKHKYKSHMQQQQYVNAQKPGCGTAKKLEKISLPKVVKYPHVIKLHRFEK